MKRQLRTTRAADLLWPLLLGISLVAVLLLVLTPSRQAQAQGPEPNLFVRKFNTNGYARPGGVYVYSVYYRNDWNAGAPATDTIIVDTLPVSTTYAGDTGGFTYTLGANGTITWHLGDLNPGDYGSFMVTVDIPDTLPTGTAAITQNCVFITSTVTGDEDPGDNDDCADPVDVWDDDVEIGVDTWPFFNDPTPGQEFGYTIQWCNYRGAAAGPAWLTDTLPVSSTFVGWGWDGGWWERYWTAVVTTGGQLVLYAPGLPGDVCQDLNVTLRLNNAPLGLPLENSVVITTAGDEDSDNDSDDDTDATVGGPRYDLSVSKRVHSFVPVPGGWINYFIEYQNNGNTETHVWLTDTLPLSLTYESAWWGGGDQPHADEPLTPTVSGNQLFFDLGTVSIGEGRWFHIQVNVSDTLAADTVVTNCVVIVGEGGDVTPEDNEYCYPVNINAAGPNLRVMKWHSWNDAGQLGYRVFFENIGSTTVHDVWISDTLPVSTTWDGWWDWEPHFDPNRAITQSQNGGLPLWNIAYLEPGDGGWIYFNANLDGAVVGLPFQWYTNTVAITIVPTETETGDNSDSDVAFSGGEVDSVHLWVNETHFEVSVPQMPVTITTAYTEVVWWWDSGDLPHMVMPGDIVTIAAGEGIHPVVIEVPDPFTALAYSTQDVIQGQIDSLAHEWVEVDPERFTSKQVQTDGSGYYTATFSDIQRGDRGEVRYRTEVDYAEVTFHRQIQSLDLIMDVNYSHDWVSGSYEAGHTIWLTVTESDSSTIKATVTLTSGPIPWWGGENGFSTDWQGWGNGRPDIEVGDWVFGLVDNGEATQVHIGLITGTVDADNDDITGRIYAPWFTEDLYVRCEEWAGIGVPGKESSAGPNGDPPYYCQWDPVSEWDVEAGQDIGVIYQGSDLNRVIGVFRAPHPHLQVGKSASGDPAEGSNFVFTIQYWNHGGDGDYAADVIITDTLLGGMTYITDTSGFTHTGSGNGPIVWHLGTVSGNVDGEFSLFVNVTATQGSPLTNTVQITTTTPHNQSAPDELYGEWSGTVQANDTRLNVGKWLEGADPAPDTAFTWMVNVCNDGSTASAEVMLTDTLPLSTTLLGWHTQSMGWTEVLSDGQQLVLSNPSLSAGRCGEIRLRFHVDADAWAGMQISNTATITAANDTTGDDDTATSWVNVSEPYVNLYVSTNWLNGQLIPGGTLDYSLRYGNNGNAPADDVYLTYTLPASTTFRTARLYDWRGKHPFTPDVVGDGYVVWDLGSLANGADLHFDISLDVSPAAAPGMLLTSTLDISRHPDDYHYDDNTAAWVEVLNPNGPNLEIDKQNYHWNGDSQIQYEMRVKNRGDVRLEAILITDTYPVSTTWDGNWWYGHGPNITTTHDAANRRIVFWLEYLDPGETASIEYQVDLDGSLIGVQGLFFTNTLAAEVVSDTYPADNYDEVVAYAGPDLYVEKWLRSGEPHPGEVVTFTVKFGNRNSWQGMDDQFGSALTDTLPSALEFITATAPWNPNQPWGPRSITGETEVVWDWGTPWENSDQYTLITARISETVESGEVLTNYVAFGDGNPNDIDRTTANDSYEFPLTVLAPAFEVDKWYDGNEVAGTVVTYTLIVTNSGNYPGTDVVLSDTVPAYLDNVGGDSLFDGVDVTWTFTEILPFGGTAGGWFSATLPCTAGLTIVNDDYLVVGSDEGVGSEPGAAVEFDVLTPTIEAGFDYTPGVIRAGDEVVFSDTSTTDGGGLGYEWAFGDGDTGTAPDGVHVYAEAGEYTVVLTVTDGCGYGDVATATLTVEPRFSVGKTWEGNGVAGSIVTYTLTVTNLGATEAMVIVSDTVPDGLSQHSGTAGYPWVGWTLGPLAPVTGTASGEFHATITCTAGVEIVNDDYGVRWSDAGAVGPQGEPVSFTVRAPTITAVFAHTQGDLFVGETVNFTGTADGDGSGLSYAWDFGDGTMGSSLVITHAYAQAGDYTVTFTATDGCGYSASATATVTIVPRCIPPTGVGLAYAPSEPVVNSPVSFTATVTPADATLPLTYTWSPEPGNGQGTPNATYTWDTTGTYTVTVTVGNCGGTVSDTQAVRVGPEPPPSVVIGPDTGGTLVYTDSQGMTTTVRFPVGAVSETLRIVFEPVVTPTQSPPGGLYFGHHSFDLNAYRGEQVLPHLTFSKPVTITINYSDADVAGMDEDEFALYRWIQASGAWERVGEQPGEGQQLYPEENRLVAWLRGLSRFGTYGAEAGQQVYLPLVLRSH